MRRESSEWMTARSSPPTSSAAISSSVRSVTARELTQALGPGDGLPSFGGPLVFAPDDQVVRVAGPPEVVGHWSRPRRRARQLDGLQGLNRRGVAQVVQVPACNRDRAVTEQLGYLADRHSGALTARQRRCAGGGGAPGVLDVFEGTPGHAGTGVAAARTRASARGQIGRRLLIVGSRV
jgi:hypothetical protein